MSKLSVLQADFLTAMKVEIRPKSRVRGQDARKDALDAYLRLQQKVLDEVVKLRTLYRRDDLAASYEVELTAERDRLHAADPAKIKAALNASTDKLKSVKERARKDVAELAKGKTVAPRAAAAAAPAQPAATTAPTTPAAATPPPTTPPPTTPPAQPETPARTDAPAPQYSDYREALKAAKDRLWEASALPHATTPAVQEHINAIKKKMDDAAKNVAAGGGVENMTQSVKLLGETAAALTSAKTASKAEVAKLAGDVAAMPTYYARLALAEKKERELKTVAGTSGAREKLATMIAAAKGKLVADDVSLQRGFAEGVEVLKGYEALAAAADSERDSFEATRRANPLALNISLPQLGKAKVALGTLRTDYPLQADAFEGELASLEEAIVIASGRSQPTEPLGAKLAALETRINQAHAEQTRFKAECGELIEVVRGQLRPIEAWAPAAAYAPVTNAIAAADKKMRAGDFAVARDHLTTAQARMEPFAALAAEGTRWKAALERAEGFPADAAGMTFAVMTERCRALVNYPRAGRAAQILGELPELKTATERDLNFTEGITQLQRYGKSVKEMWDQYAGAGDGAADPAAFAAYGRARQLARNKIDEAARGVQEKLALLEKAMTGVKNPATTGFHTGFKEIMLRWQEVDQRGADPDDAAGGIRAATQYVELKSVEIAGYLNTMRTNIEPLLVKSRVKKNAGLEELIKTAKEEDIRIEKDARYKAFPKLLERLKEVGGDERMFRLSYQALENVTSAATKESRLTALETDVKRQIAALEPAFNRKAAEKQAQLTTQRQGATTKKTALEGKLAKLAKGKDAAEFKEYLDSFKEQAADLNVLINSDDPELIRQAEQDLERLTADVDKLGDGEKSKPYGAVKELWTKLAKSLAAEAVGIHMKDTKTRLRAQLEAAIADAKTRAPAEGERKLRELEAAVDACAAAAATAKVLYAGFEQRVEGVEARQEELRRLSSTRMTDRTTAYNDRLVARFDALKKLALTEGGIPPAMAELNAIDAEIQAMMAAPDPRAALQQADIEAKRAHEELRAMVELFQAGVTSFEQVEHPAAEAAVAKAGDDGDHDKLKDLGKAKAQIVKMLDKYAAIFSYKPVDWLTGSPLTPQQTKEAKQAFVQGQTQLEAAREAARWLTANPVGNQVQARQELPKVNQAWKDRTVKFNRAIQDLARNVKAEADEEGVREDLKEMARKVHVKLQKVRTLFDAEAFQAAVTKLTAKGSDKATRQAAREEALRVVRHYRKLMVADPVLKAVRAPDNPFHKVHVESGMLRSALKNIELNILGCV